MHDDRNIATKFHTRLVTDKELCEYLGIDRKTSWRLRTTRGLPYLKIGGGSGTRSRQSGNGWNPTTSIQVGSIEVSDRSIQSPAPLIYTVRDVAKVLKLSERKVWQLLKEGKLKAAGWRAAFGSA